MKLRMFEDKNFWKSMLRLALPIAFQNLLTTSLSLVDTLMIGRLGDVSIAAVGIASQVADVYKRQVYPCIEFPKFPEGQTGQRGKAEITSLDISRFYPH